jgi:hypothetical protein
MAMAIIINKEILKSENKSNTKILEIILSQNIKCKVEVRLYPI